MVSMPPSISTTLPSTFSFCLRRATRIPFWEVTCLTTRSIPVGMMRIITVAISGFSTKAMAMAAMAAKKKGMNSRKISLSRLIRPAMDRKIRPYREPICC